MNSLFNDNDQEYLNRIRDDIETLLQSEDADIPFNAFERLLFLNEKFNTLLELFEEKSLRNKELLFRLNRCAELLSEAKCSSGKATCTCQWCYDKNLEMEYYKNEKI